MQIWGHACVNTWLWKKKQFVNKTDSKIVEKAQLLPSDCEKMLGHMIRKNRKSSEKKIGEKMRKRDIKRKEVKGKKKGRTKDGKGEEDRGWWRY